MIDFTAIIFKCVMTLRTWTGSPNNEPPTPSATCQVIQPQVRATGVYKINPMQALSASFMWNGGWRGHINLKAGYDPLTYDPTLKEGNAGVEGATSPSTAVIKARSKLGKSKNERNA